MSIDHDTESNWASRLVQVYVVAVMLLSVVGVVSIVALTMVRPDQNHSDTIVVILGFLVPTVSALTAGAVAHMQRSVNGRLTQLLALTARVHAAEGELAGRKASDQERDNGA